MPTTIANQSLESTAPSSAARARAWRPFPRDVADVLCAEEPAGDMRPRIHGRLAITLLRTPASVRVESSRSIVAAASSLLLVPAWQLHAVRAQGGVLDDAAQATSTLLLGAVHLDGLALGEGDRPALVADDTLVADVEALVAQLRRPMRSIECATAIRSLLARLLAGSTPAVARRVGAAATPLGRVRDHLRANLAEPVAIAALARMSGLTESHLIRAFHREFGLPPHAYHTRLRLAAACEQLADGLSVSGAAYECGFADQSHLSRRFKEVYGFTPAAWATAVADTRRYGVPPDARQAVARRVGRRDAQPATRWRGAFAGNLH